MLIAEFYILGSVAKIVGIVVVSCFTGKVGKAGERRQIQRAVGRVENIMTHQRWQTGVSAVFVVREIVYELKIVFVGEPSGYCGVCREAAFEIVAPTIAVAYVDRCIVIERTNEFTRHPGES